MESALGGRPTRLFARAGAAAGLLLSRFPLRLITNEALACKGSPETIGFWTSFCVQELLPKFRRSRESAFFYSRCRYIGWLKGVVLLPGESILPSGRTTSFFIWAGAAAGLLLSQFPRHLISNETLEGKGNPKTIGFCWRSLVPFCPEANTHHFSRIFLCFFR